MIDDNCTPFQKLYIMAECAEHPAWIEYRWERSCWRAGVSRDWDGNDGPYTAEGATVEEAVDGLLSILRIRAGQQLRREQELCERAQRRVAMLAEPNSVGVSTASAEEGAQTLGDVLRGAVRNVSTKPYGT